MKKEKIFYAYVLCTMCLMYRVFIQPDSLITRHLWGKYTGDFKLPSKIVSKWIFHLQYQGQEEYIIWAVPNGITQTTGSSDENRVYENEITRAGSFSLFPRNDRVTCSVDELIRSGFIYSGSGDCVTCYVCGNSYCNWHGDEILSELHTQNCRYRLLNDHSDAEQNYPTHSSASDSRDIASGSDSRDIACGQSLLTEHRFSETFGQTEDTTLARNDSDNNQSTTRGDNTSTAISNLSSYERSDLEDANGERRVTEVSDTSLFPGLFRQNSRHQLLVSEMTSNEGISDRNATNNTGCHTYSNTDANLSDELGYLNIKTRKNTTAQDTTSVSDQRQMQDFSDVVTRIESFQRGGSSVLDLAMNGLWCDVTGNTIRCFSYEYVFENWTEFSDPIEAHQIQQRHCPYLEEMRTVHTGANYMIDYEVLERLPAIYILLQMNYSWDIICVAINDTVSEVNSLSLNRLHADDILNRIFGFTGKEESFFAERITEEESTEEDYAAILKENAALKDNILCIICCEGKKCVTFCPCGHFICCDECSRKFSQCPMCREAITSRQHVVLAKFKRDT